MSHCFHQESPRPSAVVLEELPYLLQKFVDVRRYACHHSDYEGGVGNHAPCGDNCTAESLYRLTDPALYTFRHGNGGNEGGDDVEDYRQHAPKYHTEEVFNHQFGVASEGVWEVAILGRQTAYNLLSELPGVLGVFNPASVPFGVGDYLLIGFLSYGTLAGFFEIIGDVDHLGEGLGYGLAALFTDVIQFLIEGTGGLHHSLKVVKGGRGFHHSLQ